jgi:carbon storage regulator
MLVLSRKSGERIAIGPGIALTVVEVRGHQVRLGIEAPPDVLVLRAELDVRRKWPPVRSSQALPLTHPR